MHMSYPINLHAYICMGIATHTYKYCIQEFRTYSTLAYCMDSPYLAHVHYSYCIQQVIANCP